MLRLARDWRLKVLAQQIVGMLPGKLGFAVNEWLVGLVRGNVDQRVSSHDRILKGVDNIELIKRETGFLPTGKHILEWGTGWHGIDLLLFHLLGAAQITTVDHHRHLTIESISARIPLFSDPSIRARLVDLGLVQERWEMLEGPASDSLTLDELLDAMAITYVVSPSSAYDRLPVEPNSIDLFYSESVLQRIPEDDLRRAILFVASTLMADGAVFFHRTDQKDINAQQHVDAALWPLDYLRYSDFVFQTFLTNRFNSQNRLRESDFLEIFELAGLSTTFVKSSHTAADIDRIKDAPLAKRFLEKDPTDLATTASQIIGVKPAT